MVTFKLYLKLKSFVLKRLSSFKVLNKLFFNFLFKKVEHRKIIVQRSPFIYKKAREQFSISISNFWILLKHRTLFNSVFLTKLFIYWFIYCMKSKRTLFIIKDFIISKKF